MRISRFIIYQIYRSDDSVLFMRSVSVKTSVYLPCKKFSVAFLPNFSYSSFLRKTNRERDSPLARPTLLQSNIDRH